MKYNLLSSHDCVTQQNNTCLKQLKLAHNRFEDYGARHFQEALSDNESLELLDLSWNHFGRVGAALLAQGVQVRHVLSVQPLRL